MNYETFAEVYDTIMDNTLYNEWLSFTKRHLTGNNILELACGTGDLAVFLAKEGFTVTGLDLSEEMLSVADQKAFDNKVEIAFLQGDMRELPEINAFDGVTCYSDSLCYLKSEEEVLQAFKGVYSNLKVGGHFLFDVHSPYQITEGFLDYSFHDQTENFAFLWDSYPGETPLSVSHYLTFFIKEGESFQRYDELHEERTYDLATFKKLLKEAGFKNIQVFGDFTDEAPIDKTRRLFFKGEK